MSVRVIDLNNEAVEEQAPTSEPIEEAKEEQQPELVNQVIEETNEETNEPPKEEVKEKPKRQTQKDRIQCPKCLKEVSLKTYRYSHEKNCGGQLSEKPVKPHTNPKSKPKAKPKQVPKPAPDVYYSDSDDYDSASDDVPRQPVVKNKKQPAQSSNPLLDITNSYALLQQQLIQQKQQRYNKVCASIFAPRSKKR
jgi:hypothetical protein